MTKTIHLTVYFSDGSVCLREEFSTRKAALAAAKDEVARGARYGYKRTYNIV